MDEQKWIERILAGDTQSFSCLVAKYEKMAYTIAFRILGNREEAEEAVQDAFVKMYRALSNFHFDSKFSTWFYRIVYRTALTASRQQRMFVNYEEAGSIDDLSNDEVESATDLLEREDRKEMIARTLRKLPADEALLLTLHYLEECSVEEICQITELSTSNVKVKLFRGRKRFYEVLQDKMKLDTADLL
ncbi:RNA polymerase sigma factor [Parabacteroides sp. ZJ-118]|uniref:RNA polymerase sigma factor n=1 Tax=Parabacteroides sp. ZJ-118 TaxID=2709398 RepID=UPI0013EB8952|nr:RNA polymerase sigma factor [Parabacteroides sp. ZJ-118]